MESKRNIPKVRFPEFVEKWEHKTLGDYYKNLRTGMTPYRGRPEYYNGDILWIASGELNYGYINDTREKITEEAVKDTNLEIYPPYTLFMAITGLEAPGTRGKCAINLLPATTNQSCMAFDKRDNIDTLFLFYWYHKYGVPLYFKYAQGTKQQSFNNFLVAQFEFIHPSITEQSKIASFLSKVEDKLTKLKKKKSLLEHYKKGVMQQIFSQELRFKDEYGNDFTVWNEKALGEIGEAYSGLTGKSKEDFGNGKPYIQYKQIFDDSRIDISRFDYVEIGNKENQNEVKFGDAFFTVSSETANEVGMASVLLDEIENLYLNSFCFGYRASKEILSPYFSRYLFHSELFRKDVIVLAQGSTRFNISKTQFMKLVVNLPSLPEQQKIASFLSSLDDKIAQTALQIEKMQLWKKGLLQQMFV